LTEAALAIANGATLVDPRGNHAELQKAIVEGLTANLKLKSNNPRPDVIADDFRRLGLDLWPSLGRPGAQRPKQWKAAIVRLNTWRNAIAHSNFVFNAQQLKELGGTARPRLREAKQCLSACDRLVAAMDQAVSKHLGQVLGSSPW
jgi:hypothetical protein